MVICLALMTALVFMTYHVYRMQRQIAELQQDVSKSQVVMVGEMTKVHDLSSMIVSRNKKSLQSIRDELDEAKSELQASAGRSRLDAEANVQRLARELKAEEQRQRELHAQTRQQLSQAHELAEAAGARLEDVKTEVTSVKSEVAETRTNLKKAVSDLRRVIGDMGVMSGLIATNARELEVLKTLGDRNYTEFRLMKSKDPQVVGNVSLVLKKADPGSRRFTLEVIADDMRVQKKDKTVNEPVQFYVARNKQPLEIVINSVGRNEVNGYLATPKLDQERE